MTRKNARTTPFPDAVANFKIDDRAGFVAEIRAKDFPEAGPNGEFRVYSVYGDVTKPEALETALHNLMIDHRVERRRIVINL